MTNDNFLNKSIFTDRQICTKNNPMPKGAKGRWAHNGARVRNIDSDYYTYWECIDCGQKWKVELPE